jgi:hypothetical protein
MYAATRNTYILARHAALLSLIVGVGMLVMKTVAYF